MNLLSDNTEAMQVPDPFEERTYLTRWKECATVVNDGFGAALAKMYIPKYYDSKVTDEVNLNIYCPK